MKIPIQSVNSEVQAIKARDDIACVLSVIPGLGHLYKGYVGGGLFLMLLAWPLMLFISLLLGMGTMGLSLLFPVLFWGAVMAHAYSAEDHRKRHWHGF
jgi:TM2 domain-containing membrane protein YozV